MPQYHKVQETVLAEQWNHPGDLSGDKPLVGGEGRIVKGYRRKDVSDAALCVRCNHSMRVHGWIDASLSGLGLTSSFLPVDPVTGRPVPVVGVTNVDYPAPDRRALAAGNPYPQENVSDAVSNTNEHSFAERLRKRQLARSGSPDARSNPAIDTRMNPAGKLNPTGTREQLRSELVPDAYAVGPVTPRVNVPADSVPSNHPAEMPTRAHDDIDPDRGTVPGSKTIYDDTGRGVGTVPSAYPEGVGQYPDGLGGYQGRGSYPDGQSVPDDNGQFPPAAGSDGHGSLDGRAQYADGTGRDGRGYGADGRGYGRRNSNTGLVVCPGDFVITYPDGYREACPPNKFATLFTKVNQKESGPFKGSVHRS